MKVDGREIPVAGSLLQPLTRRTSDILRVVFALVLLGAVIAGSVITRSEWDALETSVSDIVGILSPGVSDTVYLLYGVAILALPFAILIQLIVGRRWKLLAGYAAAGLIAGIALSFTGSGLSAPRWHLDVSDRLNTFLSQFLDDPRWIAMLAAVLTVSGPWLPKRWRRVWWALLLLFAPIHLIVSSIVPARSMLGLAVGYLVGAIIVLVVGTPALEVPLESAVEALGRLGHRVTAFRVIAPAGSGPLVLGAARDGEPEMIVELYGQNQRSRGVLRQVSKWLTLRSSESTPVHASLARAVEHRALMGIAVADLGLAASKPMAVTALDRGWKLYARPVAHGAPIATLATDNPHPRDTLLEMLWRSLGKLHAHQMTHGDLRASEIRIDDDQALFDGFAYAELGPSEAQIQSDTAQLLLTTAGLFGVEAAVRAALAARGRDRVLAASGRLTKSAMPSRLRKPVPDSAAMLGAIRDEVSNQTDIDKIAPEQVTRFTRNQIIQLVLLIGLVYVAYPFISQVPTFLTELKTANWAWGLVGLVVSALTYVGAAAALWACASELVRYRDLLIMQIANTFAATTTPAGVGGLALSVRFLQKGGLGTVRATAAVALQQTVQVVTHVALLVFFSVAAGRDADLAHFVPRGTTLYLIAGVALGAVGTFMFIPKARRWLRNEVRPQLTEVLGSLTQLARNPGRFLLIVLGSAGTTLGAALALWASVEAFGGGTTFVTVTVVTMIGGTLASAAPTPGGVGAVEAALIGGLTAFGLPVGIAVPSVLLYRVLTCWLPVFCGWPTLRWLQKNDMV
ncbi:lysylphosphatidylglycerol synthase transmembrane domain-containing protein [Rhodococcus sp. SGAir0479]|uniref:lysylphosphatidylglycerol synthase transmembrane domain-containing protein n=1 Tax=Rhodococcus sp. SGAir0479 TaxID=2567884 RepID=UPI0010CCBACC|nr:lysylphosphatidylglycerol synthase transmembrane domain-containing protein [Rhodococcus sp. SGAir0479]QCQ89916.1 flippase-like domain-containing protein [Rhodococcus sp. SGAir0479]